MIPDNILVERISDDLKQRNTGEVWAYKARAIQDAKQLRLQEDTYKPIPAETQLVIDMLQWINDSPDLWTLEERKSASQNRKEIEVTHGDVEDAFATAGQGVPAENEVLTATFDASCLLWKRDPRGQENDRRLDEGEN